MNTMKERWTAAKPLVYQQIASEIQSAALYEMNCSRTWQMVKTRVETLVEPLIPLGYLEEFHVLCNDTNNTPDTIEANEFHLDFAWKLAGESKFTVVNFVLSPRGMEIVQ